MLLILNHTQLQNKTTVKITDGLNIKMQKMTF